MGNTADDGQGSAEFVEHEFRLILCFIYDCFSLTVMFDEMDTSGSMLLDAKEFKAAVPTIGVWGFAIDDVDASFKEIDDGSG
ncbi:hypothetical protein LSCM1_05731 [Leishmania martiniquensis]|uniref:EF-hand domain-containing protein n=1 Tax=Leishmania martiniquensis TaxID=1580590 RepID=A0A836KQP5_9TRYP|nr:hypothetical protein LSCM1_05728 [Leishmania martiniquensis]KAG5482017.1 hypothetical protein LSCM1_05731 [Leishmania martiniquensis]